MPNKCKLTGKQQKFAEEYIVDLNATQAAIRAGYAASSCKLSGHNNITKYNVVKEIERLQAKERRKSIANRKQRQQFWTEVYNDKASNMGDRLRASELLGKSECDFIEKSINLNADIPTEPEAYKAWLQRELEKVEGTKGVIESYDKSRPAIAERY